MSDLDSLAAELTALVHTVPGVSAVYPADPLVRSVARRVITGHADAVVRVERVGGILEVSARIGVSGEAPVVTRRVSAALSAALTAAAEPFRLAVTVGSVD